MKKIISALLALALSISLCACGNTDANGTEETTTGTQTTETTTETTVQTESEDEKALKQTKARYEKANKYLAEYLENGYFYYANWNSYRGNAATEYLYKEFEALGDYEDSAEILSRFTIVPGMLTSITNTKTDNLGNVEKDTYESYEYDEKGTSSDEPILELLGISDFGYDCEYEYDDTDRIISLKLVTSRKTVVAIIKPEYDANGNIVKTNCQTNDNTYTQTYAYDEKNRVIKKTNIYHLEYTSVDYAYRYDEKGQLIEEIMFFDDPDPNYVDIEFKTTYTYSENGNILKVETSHCYAGGNVRSCYRIDVCEYEYDANGYLVMKKEIYTGSPGKADERQSVTQFLYTNDENGRPISAELIETEDGKNAYASQILTYNYETLYFYDAE